MAQKKQVLVALSGGVDSSTAAALLQRHGYACSGVFMYLGQGRASDGTAEPRPGPDVGAATLPPDMVPAADDAAKVASRLGIPFEVLDCRADLAGIVDYFIAEYRRGRTPNPCVMCNRRLKFGKLLEHARRRGADYLATGHYARIIDTDKGKRLARAVDPAKDQSYALFGIGRRKLEEVLFPLGGYRKDQVRRMAARLELPVYDKEESQEICFVPDDDYAGFLAARAPELRHKGPVVDAAGRVLGEHEGVFRYTIGQRRGLGIALGTPAYVIGLDAAANTVVLGGRAELLSRSLWARDVVWLVDPPDGSFAALVQIRYNHRGAPARVMPLAGETGGDLVKIDFATPVSAVTPGQAAVFYDQHQCVLGGGWIERAGP